MLLVVGIIIVFAMVFGGYSLAGGHFDVLIQAAPVEFMIIFGAAMGAFVIGNSITTIKATAGGIGKIASGPKWKAQDYQDLLVMDLP